jgi:hypothetical protein
MTFSYEKFYKDTGVNLEQDKSKEKINLFLSYINSSRDTLVESNENGKSYVSFSKLFSLYIEKIDSNKSISTIRYRIREYVKKNPEGEELVFIDEDDKFQSKYFVDINNKGLIELLFKDSIEPDDLKDVKEFVNTLEPNEIDNLDDTLVDINKEDIFE